ncbi:MAG: tautomerase family protein [Halanaeroarchaeum sp.]
MPYLQCDADFSIDEETADQFERDLATLYAERMNAETNYIAVAVRDDLSLFLGRSEGERRVICMADIREGRSVERKRDLALAIIDLVEREFGVPSTDQKIVFTEHAGHQMMGADRVGDEWSKVSEE